MTLYDTVHSATVARRTNDPIVSRRAARVIFISATNTYRRGIQVAGDFATKASGRTWRVFLAQVANSRTSYRAFNENNFYLNWRYDDLSTRLSFLRTLPFQAIHLPLSLL